jgi:transposase, IS5 family
MAQPGFFDLDNRYESISKLSDPLEVLDQAIPWETFRPVLSKVMCKFKKSNEGRKPYDSVFMFRILVLQSLNNLSDDQTEFMIKDDLSFMLFLSLDFEDTVPDAKTLWLFRDTLSNKNTIDKLFIGFNRYLDREGLFARQGQFIDASIVPVPVQRNNRKENTRIKHDEVPEEWQEQPHKLQQKDTDARWVKKNGRSHYGYKNYVNADRKHKLILTFVVTDASVHDSRVFDSLLDSINTGKQVFADSAYRSKEINGTLKERVLKNEIHHKGYRGTPLTEAKQRVNHKRSKVRAAVEHIFGFQQNSLGGKFIRATGILRARAKIGLMNLAYNMKRYVYLTKNKPAHATG